MAYHADKRTDLAEKINNLVF